MSTKPGLLKKKTSLIYGYSRIQNPVGNIRNVLLSCQKRIEKERGFY